MTDCRNKKIEMKVNVDQEVPDVIACDQGKFKQVVLNLLQQTITSQLRGTVTLTVYLETPDEDEIEEQKENEEKMVVIDIQNSKFEVKAKDANRLQKLGQEYEFSKILESKCDLNFKIVKVLTNAVNWEVDFSAFRQGKMIFRVPAKKYVGGAVQQPEERFIDIQPPSPKESPRSGGQLDNSALDLPQLNQLQSVDLDTMPERVKRNPKKRDKWEELLTKQKT